MNYFDCDYSMGAHPRVMEALVRTNLQHTPGYGLDPYSKEARGRILDACGLSAEEAQVHFTIGGTQTNAVAIDWWIRRSEGVICADTAHINVHESGAIEASGHKILALPACDGKITASDINDYVNNFYADDTWAHMVIPRVVYLTYPTELGTLYTLSELEAIAEVCRRHELVLYIDGARMAYALAAQPEVTLKDIARLADSFYIGGTKCGTLIGEALVIKARRRRPNLFTHIKMHGALLAKGRLMGIQFGTLFSDGLYQEIGRVGVDMARSVVDIFAAEGYRPVVPSPTNQQFFRLPNRVIDSLAAMGIVFELWGPRTPGGDEVLTMVRFVTSWATTPGDITALSHALQ